MEESEGIDKLVPKNTTKLSYRYLQNVMLIVFFLLRFSKCAMNDSSHNFVLQFRFESSKSFVLLIIEKLTLFKVEHIQNIPIFKLLFIQIRDTISCFLALSRLHNVYMTRTFKVRCDTAR